MNSNVDYQELNTRIEKAVRRQKLVIQGVFFGVSVMLFVIFGIMSIALEPNGTPWLPAFLMGLGWLLTLVWGGISLVMNLGWMDGPIRKQVLMQELGQNFLEQMAAAAVESEKPKRAAERLGDEVEDVVELSDDGELIRIQRRQTE